MAWNPGPEVAAARDAARKLDAPMAVLVYLTRDGRVGMASFGETMPLCREAGKLGDYLFDKALKWGDE